MSQPYQLTISTAILRVADGAMIPPDPANRDYAAYQSWVAQGNTADPVPTPPAPTVQQQAVALLSGAPVTLTSTATPALNGVYLVDPVMTANLTAIQLGISSGAGLPGGGSTVPYPDTSDTDHDFTATQFTTFATAVLGYVFALNRCALGKLSTLPAPTLSIA